MEAIKKLKDGRAPGVCGITSELLKAGGQEIAMWLHSVISEVWESAIIPTDWRKGIIVPFWKGKGDRSDCGNYRGITLLSTPSKVFARILLSRIRQHLLETQRPEQSGFTPGKSTIDQILALRLLAERRREYRQPLFAAYVDLKKAFDSVDRRALWQVLLKRGIPCKLVELISALYSNTFSCVRVGTDTTDWFPVDTGVRQGCVLAPTLFNAAVDRVMKRTMTHGSAGVSFGDEIFTDLDYADDVVLLAETIDTLQLSLSSMD